MTLRKRISKPCVTIFKTFDLHLTPLNILSHLPLITPTLLYLNLLSLPPFKCYIFPLSIATTTLNALVARSAATMPVLVRRCVCSLTTKITATTIKGAVRLSD